MAFIIRSHTDCHCFFFFLADTVEMIKHILILLLCLVCLCSPRPQPGKLSLAGYDDFVAESKLCNPPWCFLSDVAVITCQICRSKTDKVENYYTLNTTQIHSAYTRNQHSLVKCVCSHTYTHTHTLSLVFFFFHFLLAAERSHTFSEQVLVQYFCRFHGCLCRLKIYFHIELQFSKWIYS